MFHLIRLISLGNPRDLSKPAGVTKSAMPYAFAGAMSPTKKESAFLYLPTYTAGIIYHLGTFSSFFLFFIIFFGVPLNPVVNLFISVFLTISGFCGFGILTKRILKSQMRELSNPDDYLSNFLVSVFQWASAAVVISITLLPVYYIVAGILFLYVPVGKLKHTVYFFAARYHLGFFFGHRGVWPPK